MSSSSFETINKNMDIIKNTDKWDEKFVIIKNTQELIKKQQKHLLELKKLINIDLEEDIDFGKMNITNVIEKIKNNNNLDEKVKSLRLLKLWINQQKNMVFKSDCESDDSNESISSTVSDCESDEDSD